MSGVWHVQWLNLITSVRLVQVGNNRNYHFRYFLGVRVHLIEVSASIIKVSFNLVIPTLHCRILYIWQIKIELN